jgi:hypothetical protein
VPRCPQCDSLLPTGAVARSYLPWLCFSPSAPDLSVCHTCGALLEPDWDSLSTLDSLRGVTVVLLVVSFCLLAVPFEYATERLGSFLLIFACLLAGPAAMSLALLLLYLKRVRFRAAKL